MNVNNWPPVFVPEEYWAELDKLTKAALMDVAWDFARQLHDSADQPNVTMAQLRERADVIGIYRKQARAR